MKKIIEFNKYIDQRLTSLVGRANGEALLRKFKNDNVIFSEIEKECSNIEIVIPKRILLMNKSFFLGFFETRVETLGKSAFLEKYEFNANDYIRGKISEYTDAALLNSTMSEILNVRSHNK